MARTIMTKCGEIRGTDCRYPGVTAFKGIRYATAGRWEYPTIVTGWEGIYDASEYGNCSYQPRAFYNEAEVPGKAFYYNEFRKGETYTYSDDCLFLNIWIPDTAQADSNLPVLFYIHGGGYTGGCGHEKHFDGPVWPTKGVIAVTCNYRVGPLGYLCLPELEARDGHTGNYGMFDQITALQWVRDNIREFGGNPDNITVMGQSAGAMSVQNLCVSPLTDGMFARAVMHSGGGVSKMMNSKATAKDRFAFWEQVMCECGCSNAEQLGAVDTATLFEVWQRIKKTSPKYGMIASPCIDGVALTMSALEAAEQGLQKDVPYMMGSTSQDMAPPMIAGMAKDWCIRQTQQNKQPSYCWFFDRQLPGDNNGAWHSSELWYFFGTLKNGWRPFTDHDYKLSDLMTDALCNFAKTGNPNGGAITGWEPTTANQKKMMIWGEKLPHMGKPSQVKMWYTMFTNKAVGE